jgi:hypothetical protein
MRQFIFYLALCSLFIFVKNTDAHPHKLGKMNHGQSLETYNIKIDFSDNQNTSDEITSNIKLADKDKDNKKLSKKELSKTKSNTKKPNKNTTERK